MLGCECGARYVSLWLRYQVLWDLEAGRVEKLLGTALDKWQLLVTQIQQASPALESGRQQETFGPTTIAYVRRHCKSHA